MIIAHLDPAVAPQVKAGTAFQDGLRFDTCRFGEAMMAGTLRCMPLFY